MVCVPEQNNGNRTMKVGLGAGMRIGPCIPASSFVYWHLTSTLVSKAVFWLTVQKLLGRVCSWRDTIMHLACIPASCVWDIILHLLLLT